MTAEGTELGCSFCSRKTPDPDFELGWIELRMRLAPGEIGYLLWCPVHAVELGAAVKEMQVTNAVKRSGGIRRLVADPVKIAHALRSYVTPLPCEAPAEQAMRFARGFTVLLLGQALRIFAGGVIAGCLGVVFMAWMARR